MIQRKIIFNTNFPADKLKYKFMKIKPLDDFKDDVSEYSNYSGAIRDGLHDVFTKRRCYVIPFTKEAFCALYKGRYCFNGDTSLLESFISHLYKYYDKKNYDAILIDDNDKYHVCKYSWFDESSEILGQSIFPEDLSETITVLYDRFLKAVGREKNEQPGFDKEFIDFIMFTNIAPRIAENLLTNTWRYKYSYIGDDLSIGDVQYNDKTELCNRVLKLIKNLSNSIIINDKTIVYPIDNNTQKNYIKCNTSDKVRQMSDEDLAYILDDIINERHKYVNMIKINYYCVK